ncbi:MAG TPA: penicillin acylase family protein [Myxococcales bacterium]|nr:penicillin acylase family protein [Myxococcales bacterium]
MSVLFFAACSGDEPKPTLTISPSGAQTASGPVTVTASPAELSNDVTWALTGPGTISGNKGLAVVYRPPVPANPAQTATVTATALGQTATVTFTPQTAALPAVGIPANAQGPVLTGNVDVTYDQNDIPHIFCGNQNDCFAVQGYIQAQDRLFQMDLFRRIARGRLASLIGSTGVSQDTQILTVFITRDLQRIEDVLVANLDAGSKAKIQAFTNGVNAYIAFLKAHPTLMPGEYAQVPGPTTPNDIPDWTLQDTLAIGRLQQFQLSETIEKETALGLFALTFAPAPAPSAHPDAARFNFYANDVTQPVKAYTLSDPDPAIASRVGGSGAQNAAAPDLSGLASGLGHVNAQMREMIEVFGSLRNDAGSNNWVVDGAHSATGFAMVANDPHLSLQYPPLFHLAAMTASDGSGLNLIGGSFAGIPGALIGRGAHVGWGVTVVGYDVTDLYQEKLTDCTHPAPLVCGAVQFNGGVVPIAVKQYPIAVKGGTATGTAVLVVPHHGPIVHYDPATQTAISMRWTGHEGNTQDLKAFLDLNNASAVGDDTAAAGTAFAALKNYAVGAQNFVLADDQGHIGYDPHALVPVRDWISPAQPPWLPLPGDSGTAEWGRTGRGDTACAANPAPADCWVADDLLPRGVNPAKGYFATANSDPAGYTDDGSPLFNTVGGTLYKYLSYDWDDPTAIRYARIAQLLKGKTTTGTQKVSLQDMQAIQSDHMVLLAKLFEDRGFYPANGTAPASSAAAYAAGRTLLGTWASVNYECPTGLTTSDPKSPAVTDTTTLDQSAGCLLFHTFFRTLLKNVFDDDMAVVAAATGQSFSGDGGAEIRALMSMLKTPNTHAFCDDVSSTFTVTASKTCEQQVVAALASAVGTLQGAYGTDTHKWLWGRVHTMTTVSQAAPLIAGGFTAGPFARPGGLLTVDVGNPSGSQSSPLGFAYGSGSNVRFISVMDPAAANAQVKMQLPGPERDAPFGVFSSSPDLIGQYVTNTYFDFLYGHQIDNKGLSTQRFSAQ